MNDLNGLLTNLDRGDKRSALYYLSRFLKQAAFFKQYRKDIFADDARSAPSDSVREATFAMIELIESSEGVAVPEFDAATYSRWAAHVRNLEQQLDPDLTEADLARAREFASSLDLPSPKS